MSLVACKSPADRTRLFVPVHLCVGLRGGCIVTCGCACVTRSLHSLLPERAIRAFFLHINASFLPPISPRNPARPSPAASASSFVSEAEAAPAGHRAAPDSKGVQVGEFEACLQWGDHLEAALLMARCRQQHVRLEPDSYKCGGQLGVVYTGREGAPGGRVGALICADEGNLVTVVSNLPLADVARHEGGEMAAGRAAGGEEEEVNVARFGLVVCTQVLARSSSPLIALLELYAVMKPGGMLVLTVPAIERALQADLHHVQHRFRCPPCGGKRLLP